jgi:hypothetical protein
VYHNRVYVLVPNKVLYTFADTAKAVLIDNCYMMTFLEGFVLEVPVASQ